MWLVDVANFRPPPPHFLVAVSTPRHDRAQFPELSEIQ